MKDRAALYVIKDAEESGRYVLGGSNTDLQTLTSCL